MKRSGGTEPQKRLAGEHAADAVSDGDVVGLGTGSTAAAAIRALGRRVDSGLDVRAIPTSHQSRALARETGIPLTSLDEATPDVAIDGADQIAGLDRLAPPVLIKGGGAAHTSEKLVDSAADRFLVVADPTKLADRLDAAVPIAVLPAVALGLKIKRESSRPYRSRGWTVFRSFSSARRAASSRSPSTSSSSAS